MIDQHSEVELVNSNAECNKIVYNNMILTLQKAVGSETASVKKTKSESLKCNNCAWSTRKARKHPNQFYTMKRFYIKEKRSWKAIGWFCPHCGSIYLDKLPRYTSFPGPKIIVASTQH